MARGACHGQVSEPSSRDYSPPDGPQDGDHEPAVKFVGNLGSICPTVAEFGPALTEIQTDIEFGQHSSKLGHLPTRECFRTSSLRANATMFHVAPILPEEDHVLLHITSANDAGEGLLVANHSRS